MTEAEIANQIIAASTSLAGLLLVFLGSIFAAFDSYSTEQKSYVKGAFRWRAIPALVGFFCATLSAGGALSSVWSGNINLIFASQMLLVMAFISMIIAAISSLYDLYS